MPRRNKRARPRPITLEQVRKAALRRWFPGDTVETIAKHLQIPPKTVAYAIQSDFLLVEREFGSRSTVDQIAAELELPYPFVLYAVRKIKAVGVSP